MMQYPTRVEPVDFAALSPRQAQIRVKLGPYGEDGTTNNMFRTFLNFPEFARSLGRLGTRVTLTGELPRPLALLAGLRVVWLCDCGYLWAHLSREAIAAGVRLEQVAAVGSGDYTALNALERLAVETVDELHDTHYLTEEKWYRLGRLGPTAVTDAFLSYGFWVTLSAAVSSMGVRPEDGIATPAPRGWVSGAGTGLTPIRDLPKRVYEAYYDLLSPEQIEQTQRLGRRGKPTTSKLQKAMINYPAFLRAISAFGQRGIDTTSLPGRVWQLAAMRTVWLGDSEYLWSQHGAVCLAQLGVTPEVLAGVAEGPGSAKLRSRDRLAVQAVDDLYQVGRLSDAAWEGFSQLGPEAVTDLVIVYGLYTVQACLARCFGTTLEEGKQGYAPELSRYRDGQHRRNHG